MGPRGGFHFLHLIGGMVCLAMLFAVLLGLLLLALGIASKRGWLPKRRPGPGRSGARPEPGAPPDAPGPEGALRILDERLARSEIEIDDYQARRDALTGNRFPPFHQPPNSPHSPGSHIPPSGPAAPGQPPGSGAHTPPPPPTVVDQPTAPPSPSVPGPDVPRPPQSPS